MKRRCEAFLKSAKIGEICGNILSFGLVISDRDWPAMRRRLILRQSLRKGRSRGLREVRVEAFGEDFGQTSWITAAECDQFCNWLGLKPGQRLLEIACGSGGVALRMAERFGVSVVGTDVNSSAVIAARIEPKRARHRIDSSFRWPMPTRAAVPGRTFDVLFCNDAIDHLRDRARAWPNGIVFCVAAADSLYRSDRGYGLPVQRGDRGAQFGWFFSFCLHQRI